MPRVGQSEDDNSMTFRTVWLILIVCAALSLVVAAMAALNTALPGIAADTGATNAQMTWILDSYTLVMAALLLPAGAIGDRVGRRGALIIGLIIFGAASAAAIWVSSPDQLIITRIVAGVGASFIMPATLSLISAGVPEGKRAIAVSIWSAVAGVGAIAGFFVTGVLLNYFSWHSVFITFSVSTIVVLLLAFTIGSSKDENPGRFDYLGSLTSMVAIGAVVYGLLEAPHRGWTDPLILLALIGGCALVAAFILIEHRREDPLLDVDLFRNRAFAAGSLAVLFQFFASFGVFFLILQQLQLVFGYSPLRSAVALFPMVAGVGVFALLGNWLAVRYSLRVILGIGIVIAGLGVVSLGVVETSDYWLLGILLGFCAVGIGLATAPSTTSIMSNTPLDNQGVGSAVNDTARELGAAIGIALAGSIMAAGYAKRIDETADAAYTQINAIDPASAGAAADAIRGSLAGAMKVTEELPPAAAPLAEQIASGAQSAFLEPMQLACIILGSILAAGGVFLGWFAPKRITEQPETPVQV